MTPAYHVKRKLRQLDLKKTKRPPVLYVLKEVYGIPLSAIGERVGRTAPRMSLYYTGKQRIRPRLLKAMKTILEEALADAEQYQAEHASGLIKGMSSFTRVVLDNFEELHT